MEIVDLTHTLSSEIPTWSGHCGFHMEITKDYSPDGDVKFRNHKMTLHAGIGTHMDAPIHCIPGGVSIADLALKNLISATFVIDISKKSDEAYSLKTEDIDDFEKKYEKIKENSFVIVYTGWARHWANPNAYRNNYRFPSVSKEAAELLMSRNINGLGIDTLSPDRPESGYPVHQLLLQAGKYIVENVANAHLVPPVGAQVFALPLKVAGATEAPIRLIALY